MTISIQTNLLRKMAGVWCDRFMNDNLTKNAQFHHYGVE